MMKSDPLGQLEVGSWTASMAAVDAAHKAAHIRLVQVEMNDQLGASIKFVGTTGALQTALAAAETTARRLNATVVTALIQPSDADLSSLIPLEPEFNELLQQQSLLTPRAHTMTTSTAIGLIETQGFTAVIEAIDVACKAANVEVIGREKLGGGFICVVIRGDVAAVHAACDAAALRLADQKLGKLIASHVIARPSASVLSLLPSKG